MRQRIAIRRRRDDQGRSRQGGAGWRYCERAGGAGRRCRMVRRRLDPSGIPCDARQAPTVTVNSVGTLSAPHGRRRRRLGRRRSRSRQRPEWRPSLRTRAIIVLILRPPRPRRVAAAASPTGNRPCAPRSAASSPRPSATPTSGPGARGPREKSRHDIACAKFGSDLGPLNLNP
jgi:hypothetical protein